MVAIFVATVMLVILVVAVFRGKFDFGFGDDSTDGWPITRQDNPWAYWIGIAILLAVVIRVGLIVAANYGVHVALPQFKL